jgi:hypothetical protein
MLAPADFHFYGLNRYFFLSLTGYGTTALKHRTAFVSR